MEQIQHVIPLNDLKEHILNEFCDCNPIFEDGVWIHNSFDKREFVEKLFLIKSFDIKWKGEGTSEIGYDSKTGRESDLFVIFSNNKDNCLSKRKLSVKILRQFSIFFNTTDGFSLMYFMWFIICSAQFDCVVSI